MSEIPPFLAEPGTDGADDGFPLPPWGVLATAAGFFAMMFVVLMIGATFVLAVQALHVDEKSLLFRYGLTIAGELGLLVVPVMAVVRFGSGPGALGLRRPTARALLEGVPIALVLWGFTLGYEKLIEWLVPAAAAQMAAEEARQMDALAGPWPLLVFAALIVAPLGEEVFFRGFVFAGLRGRLGFAVASGLSAVAFAALHWMLWSTIAFFVIGLACALAYERHKTLYAALSVHVCFNGLSLLLKYSFGL
jgi:membrane protease YdiL (CAAX protease family)